MPLTSFCELPGDDHLTFVPAVVLVYHPSCVAACASKHVVSARWRTTSFYSFGSNSSGSEIWANVNRSWWPDCLTCTFTRLDSARLFPVGPHEELGLRDPCGFRGRPSGAGYGCGRYVGQQGIDDRVYENIIRRYLVC